MNLLTVPLCAALLCGSVLRVDLRFPQPSKPLTFDLSEWHKPPIYTDEDIEMVRQWAKENPEESKRYNREWLRHNQGKRGKP